MVCDKGIPLQIAAAVLQYGKDLGSRTLFNPSPKLEYLPQSVYVNCDVLVLNKDEGESLTQISADDSKGTKKVLCKLHEWGVSQIVLTLGAEGAVCSDRMSQHKGGFM